MTKSQKQSMKMMQTGQMTDAEAADALNISLDEARMLFVTYAKRKKLRKTVLKEFFWFFAYFDFNSFLELFRK